MSYVVTARKWRPMVFEDVVGQSHVTTTLRNAIAQNRLSHSYIFSGPRGVGKTTTARILARAINCAHPENSNPDNTCELCREIIEGRSVNVFEIDGASNRGIDEIRNLREAVRYGPPKGKYKIYIIDEVHMLTKEAFNALLKTLEEPPPHILFIFATTEVHKVPLTILSRCQRFDFRRNTIDEITGRLRFIAAEEGLAVAEDALLHIAKRADGSMRDAQSIFDQIAAFCGRTIDAAQVMEVLNIVDQELFFRVTDIIRSRDAKAALMLVEEIMSRGYDVREFLNGLTEHFRNFLVVLATGATGLIEASGPFKQRYQADASAFTEGQLLRFIKIAGEADNALRWSQQPRYKLEVSLLLMVKMESAVPVETLLEQIEELKKNFNTPPPAVMPAPPRQPELVNKTSVPVLSGNVKATQPTLRADQVVPQKHAMTRETLTALRESTRSLTSSVASFSLPRTTESRLEQPAAAAPPATGALLSADELKGKWSALIEETRKQKIALGSMLSETRLIDARENRLHIGCPDEFHLDTLQRNRELLVQIAQSVYGAKIRIEPVVSAGGAVYLPQQEYVQTGSAPQENVRNEPENSPSGTDDLTQHPVIRALVQELGARPIEG